MIYMAMTSRKNFKKHLSTLTFKISKNEGQDINPIILTLKILLLNKSNAIEYQTGCTKC